MNVERGCGADSPKHGQENGLQVLLLNATGEKLRLEVFLWLRGEAKISEQG